MLMMHLALHWPKSGDLLARSANYKLLAGWNLTTRLFKETPTCVEKRLQGCELRP